MTSDERQLRQLLQEIYDVRVNQVRISPSWLATEAMSKLDPKKQAPMLVYRGCHLQLRQLGRRICRARFEDDGPETEQHELFPNLQKRYPAAHSSESDPEYVLLEHLAPDDVKFNVKRLRSEADSKHSHANALEAWWEDRQKSRKAS